MSEHSHTDTQPEVTETTVAQQTDSGYARLLYPICLSAVLAGGAYFAWSSKAVDPVQLFAGELIFMLAVVPGLIWAKKGGRELPLFEVLMLTTANIYALPLLNSAATLLAYGPDTIHSAALAVLLYQIAAIGAYYALRGRPGRSPIYREEVISHDINRYIGYGLTLTTIYTYVSTFMPSVLPFELAGTLRAVFGGIGLISVFVQSRRWGQKTLSPQERSIFVVNVIIQLVIQFSTLFLVGGIALIVLALVGYVTGGRRLPVFATVSMLFLIALLHNGKGTMRAKYWDFDGGHRQPALAELPAFFSEWVQDGLPTGEENAPEDKMTSKLLERTSLIHILCLVVSYTPERQPFLNGKTYMDIPAQFVPRPFWREKPVAHISTYTLCIYYGLQSEEETAKTTIGFGMVPEAYANFGLFGVGVLGCLFGLLYKKVQTLTATSPLLSYPGLCVIVLMAWSFQTEYTVSMWLSSMAQAWVAVTGIPFVIRNFLG